MVSEVIQINNCLLEGLRSNVARLAKGKFKPGERVAIKLHMGEWGNLFYLRPPYARVIVEELLKIGAKPFLFDSPAMYAGGRDTSEKYLETAKKNGFTEETMGCPIVISNEGVEIETSLGKIEACKALLDADGMVVLSHFKGHELTNYGGAIKNLGMGAFTKSAKAFMHANTGSRIAHIERCTACRVCIPACPFSLLSIKDNKISMKKCSGCSACVVVCPNQVFEMRNMPLSKYLAEVTSKLLAKLDPKKLLYVNVLMDIVGECDCVSQGFEEGHTCLVAPNIGILISEDIVAIDQASLDFVNKATGGAFGKLKKIDANWQTETGEQLGLGSRSYQLSN